MPASILPSPAERATLKIDATLLNFSQSLNQTLQRLKAILSTSKTEDGAILEQAQILSVNPRFENLPELMQALQTCADYLPAPSAPSGNTRRPAPIRTFGQPIPQTADSPH